MRRQTAHFGLSQVNPFHGINEGKIPRDSAAAFVQSWEREQREDGNSGAVVGIGAGKGHTQLLPLLQDPGDAQGSQNYGIFQAGMILSTRISECWFCPGHPNSPTKSAQRLL